MRELELTLSLRNNALERTCRACAEKRRHGAVAILRRLEWNATTAPA